MNMEEITGFVLAGGKSSRMGEDKSMMIWKGKRLIEYAIETLRPICSNVIISSNTDQYQFTGCEVWPDELPVQASMIGIWSCLKRSQTELNIFLSCDMPLVPASLFEYLLSNSGTYDVIVPTDSMNQIEPLCGIYRHNLIQSFERAINEKDYSLHKFIKNSNHRLLSISSDLSFFHRDMFLNINTKEDFNNL
jgi:molybdenum cofactor guanylyltransferase